MINEILTAAGIPYAKSRFVRVPTETHAVYFDDIETDGADPVAPLTRSGLPKVLHHSVRVELYEYAADDEAEAKLEAEFDAAGVAWTKEDRHWLADSAWYQVIYEIEYITK